MKKLTVENKAVEYDKFAVLRDKSEADMFNKHALGYCDNCGGLVTDNGNSKSKSVHKIVHRFCFNSPDG